MGIPIWVSGGDTTGGTYNGGIPRKADTGGDTNGRNLQRWATGRQVVEGGTYNGGDTTGGTYNGGDTTGGTLRVGIHFGGTYNGGDTFQEWSTGGDTTEERFNGWMTGGTYTGGDTKLLVIQRCGYHLRNLQRWRPDRRSGRNDELGRS